MKKFKKGKQIAAVYMVLCMLWILLCPYAVVRAQEQMQVLTDGVLEYRPSETLAAVSVSGVVGMYAGHLEIPAVFDGLDVIAVEDAAFAQQIELTSVSVPDSVQRIGAEAFYGCVLLEEISLENTLQSVGVNAFAETAWSAAHQEDVILLLDEIVMISAAEDLTELKVPDTVRIIADEACAAHTALESVTLSAQTGYVGTKSFYGCTGLRSAVIPSGVKSIGSYAFADSALTRLTVPATVLSVGKGAFLRCTQLEQVTLWDGILRIDGSAFAECSSLKQVTVPNSVTNLGASAFRQCSALQKVVLGRCVTTLADSLFRECSALSEVTFGGAVQEIGSGAFNKCTSLRRIALPDSVTSIGPEAFQTCLSLTEITLPPGLLDIGKNAFFDTAFYNNLRAEYPESPFIISGDVLLGYEGDMTSLELPYGVRVIGGAAFAANENIEYIFFPKTVTCISSYAFDNLCELKQVYGLEQVQYIGEYAFWDCASLQQLTIPGSVGVIREGLLLGCTELSSVTVEEGITEIGEDAFCLSGLQSVILPASVSYIEENAFAECAQLAYVSIYNPECVLEEGCLPPETVLRGYISSTAELYASIYGNSFADINQWENTTTQTTTTGTATTTSSAKTTTTTTITTTTTPPKTTTTTTTTTTASTMTTTQTTTNTTITKFTTTTTITSTTFLPTFTTMSTITTTTTFTTPPTSTTTTTTQSSDSSGDVNGDGTVDLADAGALLYLYAQKAANLLTADQEKQYLTTADTDLNGGIDMEDVRLVLRYFSLTGAGEAVQPFPNWRDAQLSGRSKAIF